MSLTPLRFKEDYDIADKKDAERIVAIAADNGFDISLFDAAKAWEAYSNSMCASWKSLDKDDDIVWAKVADKFEEA